MAFSSYEPPALTVELYPRFPEGIPRIAGFHQPEKRGSTTEETRTRRNGHPKALEPLPDPDETRWPDLCGLRVFELHESHGLHVHLITNRFVDVVECRKMGKQAGMGEGSC
jgi:hypothetical protein